MDVGVHYRRPSPLAPPADSAVALQATIAEDFGADKGTRVARTERGAHARRRMLRRTLLQRSSLGAEDVGASCSAVLVKLAAGWAEHLGRRPAGSAATTPLGGAQPVVVARAAKVRAASSIWHAGRASPTRAHKSPIGTQR